MTIEPDSILVQLVIAVTYSSNRKQLVVENGKTLMKIVAGKPRKLELNSRRKCTDAGKNRPEFSSPFYSTTCAASTAI
jgi:hypothetical protein